MVGIISILASMLLPALSTVKARAVGLVCMNRQRQLWFASMAYANDYKDWTEPGTWFLDDGHYYWVYWHWLFAYGYVDFPHTVTLRGDGRLAVGWNARKWHATWGCPARPYSYTVFGSDHTLGINYYHDGDGGKPGCRVKNIKRPSHLFFMGDSSQSNGYILQIGGGWPKICHESGSNFVYIDGHAKWWHEGVQAQYFSAWPYSPAKLPWRDGTQYGDGSRLGP